MRVRILGAAAGGGLPQWNCGCRNCNAARAGEIASRTQSSAAVTVDDRHWFLLNVSADVRAQLAASADFSPKEFRQTPIAGCVLTDAEIDHTSGLLQLREGCPFNYFVTQPVLDCLSGAAFPLSLILHTFVARSWCVLPPDESLTLDLPSGKPSGLSVRAIPLGCHPPRYIRSPRESDALVVALELQEDATGATLLYAPGLPDITPSLRTAAEAASCLLIDGTFWSDDEPRKLKISKETATQMGHRPVTGKNGTLAWLAALPAPHKAYVHINNTNPMLDQRNPQHRRVVAQSVRIAHDGDEFTLGSHA
jgi:pyrroloquinoline quinone biosynthesis protein B